MVKRTKKKNDDDMKDGFWRVSGEALLLLIVYGVIAALLILAIVNVGQF